MKNDSSFRIVAAIIIFGAIVALVSPSHSSANHDLSTPTEALQTE